VNEYASEYLMVENTIGTKVKCNGSIVEFDKPGPAIRYFGCPSDFNARDVTFSRLFRIGNDD